MPNETMAKKWSKSEPQSTSDDFLTGTKSSMALWAFASTFESFQKRLHEAEVKIMTLSQELSSIKQPGQFEYTQDEADRLMRAFNAKGVK